MKIDLHCHTKKIKTGEADTRNVDVGTFYEKIRNADVKIVAITNHNHFDFNQYSKFVDKAQPYCQVWPGIEFDMKSSDGNRWHLIIVVNPDNANLFNDAVHKLMNKEDVNTCVHEIETIYNEFNHLDIIYIPHFHKKPAISEKDSTKLEAAEKVIEIKPYRKKL